MTVKDLTEVFKQGTIIALRGRGEAQECVFLPLLETEVGASGSGGILLGC